MRIRMNGYVTLETGHDVNLLSILLGQEAGTITPLFPLYIRLLTGTRILQKNYRTIIHTDEVPALSFSESAESVGDVA